VTLLSEDAEQTSSKHKNVTMKADVEYKAEVKQGRKYEFASQILNAGRPHRIVRRDVPTTPQSMACLNSHHHLDMMEFKESTHANSVTSSPSNRHEREPLCNIALVCMSSLSSSLDYALIAIQSVQLGAGSPRRPKIVWDRPKQIIDRPSPNNL